MKKVIHLIPFDGIGGVESAARTMAGLVSYDINFEILYIFRKQNRTNNYISSLSILRIFTSLYKLYIAKPDLIIVSLWRSCIVAILFKLLRPKSKIVLFLHYPHHYHLIDKALTTIVSLMCISIWADSKDTLNSRIPSFPLSKSHVISFVARRLKPLQNRNLKPNFIFWGRLHEQKSISRAIEIFADIQSQYQQATYTIIGPDGGELSHLQKQVKELGIEYAVNFTGPQDLKSIKEFSNNASFYLQTSRLEGMAMSVVEAMQLGLLPVVTPVGEIKNYCEHLKNSILVTENKSAVSSVIRLIENKYLYEEMKNKAIEKWKDYEIYSESVLRASRIVLNLSN